MMKSYRSLFRFFVHDDTQLTLHKKIFKVVHKGSPDFVVDKVYACAYEIQARSSSLSTDGSSFHVVVTKDHSTGTVDLRVTDTTPDVPRNGIVMRFHKEPDGELFFYGVEERADQEGSGWMFGSLMAGFLAWEAWYGYDLMRHQVQYTPRATENTEAQEWIV